MQLGSSSDPPASRSPEELADALGAQLSSSGGDAWARAVLDVPLDRWVEAAQQCRDSGYRFFDWLAAVDEGEAGFALVAHLWSVADRRGLLLRTVTARETPSVPTLTDVFAGAAWHEREAHEMFGVDFPGHPGLAPLLLPPEFEGHPMRKEFVLASRVAKPWPGAKEPGESHAAGTPKRQPMRPPGVPAPDEWGPNSSTREHGDA